MATTPAVPVSQAVLAGAIEGVYRERFVPLVRVATAICGNEDAAVDAVHDAFATALDSAQDYRGDGSLDGWIWRIVVNTARNRRRGRARELRRRLRDPYEAESRAPADHDPAVRAAVAALPERQRLVVFLRYFGDLDYAQIAEALQISQGTVGATLSQAHASLRTHLAADDHGEPR